MDTICLIHLIIFVLGYFVVKIKYNLAMSIFLNEIRRNPLSIKGFIGISILYFLSFTAIPFFSLATNLSNTLIMTGVYFYIAAIIIIIFSIMQLISFIGIIIDSEDIMSLQQMLRHYAFATIALIMIIAMNICNIFMTIIANLFTFNQQILLLVFFLILPLLYGLFAYFNIISSRSFIVQIEYILISLSMYIACNTYSIVEINFLNLMCILFPSLLFLQIFDINSNYKIFAENDMPIDNFKEKYENILNLNGINLNDVDETYRNDMGQNPLYVNDKYIMALRTHQMKYMFKKYWLRAIFTNKKKNLNCDDLVNFDYINYYDNKNIHI